MTMHRRALLFSAFVATAAACSATEAPPRTDAPTDAGRDGALDGSGPPPVSTPDGSTPPTGKVPDHALVVYWGQNAYGGAHPTETSKYEKPLAEVCAENPAYDVVVLGFVTSFVRTRNASGLPELNFANHCETPYGQEDPFLLKCDDIAAGIEACHQKGKRVLLSLGGASGGYGFASDAEGETFAQTAWDVFLGGKGAMRPFGARILDGIDLDIERGGAIGYSAFVRKLRSLMSADVSRTYYVSGAPQCPYPDAYLGPSKGAPLGDVPQLFDWVFVQFYNNPCEASRAVPFGESWAQWSKVSQGGRPKVFVGLPATTDAARAESFVSRADLPRVMDTVGRDPAFGGVMLWDASNDANSRDASGATYGAHVKTLLP